jgi:hypothetical protein
MRLFDTDPETREVLLNKVWIMLIPDLAALVRRDKGGKEKGDYRGDKKLRAIKEFTFIYHMVDFGSPLRDWNPDERWKEALRYASLEDKDIDEAVLKAKDCYNKLMLKAARSLRTYRALLKTLDSLDGYYENIDFTQVDKKGELLHDPISIANGVDKMDKVHTSVSNFAKRVEEELKADNSGIRGTAEMGDMEAEGKREWSEQDIMSGSEANRTNSTGTFQNMMLDLQKMTGGDGTEDDDNNDELENEEE